MDTKIVEHNELIAKRVPPGDQWVLIKDPKKEVFKSILSPRNRAKLETYLNRKEINQAANAILKLREPISTNPLRFRNRNQVRAEVFSILNIR